MTGTGEISSFRRKHRDNSAQFALTVHENPVRRSNMVNSRKYEKWAELYQKALFEDDAGALGVRVEAAQHAIQERARELWRASSAGQPIDLRERYELETAMYFLKLLRSLRLQRAGDS
jgi:hypothetical protein